MKAGRASRTAEMVCRGRAVAHARRLIPSFSDPTAFELLPPEQQRGVRAFLAGERPGSHREGFERGHLRTMAPLMAVRSACIDAAIVRANAPQVVLLGAGLDGRAFRMNELRDSSVFEVDHPDSQRDKIARAARLTPACRVHRYVPVDFTCDSLDEALSAAGHDPALPTTWVWEGVVMYLSHEDIEATLHVVQKRSGRASALAVLYHTPSLGALLVGLVTRAVGEPLRSRFRPEQLAHLLTRHGFSVDEDHSIAELGARYGGEVARRTRLIRHLHVAVAHC